MNNTNPIFNLKNFRSFGETDAVFEIAPITILTGKNSAGKSSAVKAQLLLNGLVKKIEQRVDDFFNNERFISLQNASLRKILSELVLHVSDKDLQLGRYDMVINDQSTSKILSFSYTIFSKPLLQNITVEMSFIGQENDVVNDGVLHHLSIKTDEMTLVELNNLEERHQDNFFSLENEHINYLAILPSFRKFMVYCIGVRALAEDQAYNFYDSDLSQEEIKKQIGIAESWIKESRLKKEEVDVYRNIKNITNISASFNAINDYLHKGTLYSWLPIFEQTNNMTKREVRDWMVEKAKAVCSKDNIQPEQWANFFCDDFEASDCDTISEYFMSIEREALSHGEIDSKGSGIPYISGTPLEEYVFLDFDGKLNVERPNKEKPSARQVYDDNHSFGEILSSLEYILLGPETVALQIGKQKASQSPNNYEVERSLKSFVRAVALMALNPEFLSNVEYINSSTTNVRRLYVLDDKDKIGEAISSFVNGDRQNYIGITKRKESLVFENENIKYAPTTFLNKWCREFEIGKVSIEGIEQGLGAVVYVERNGKKRLMAEEGYGITQLFTLILQIECCILNATRTQVLTGEWSLSGNSYRVDYEPQFVYVEEPEIHLHPKFQSMLADMFVDAYNNYNIRFIIETHSEYLVRRLQVMIADKDIPLTPNEVSLNYVEKDETTGISTNRQIKILEDGRLSEPFGTGFLDEAGNSARNLLLLKVKK